MYKTYTLIPLFWGQEAKCVHPWDTNPDRFHVAALGNWGRSECGLGQHHLGSSVRGAGQTCGSSFTGPGICILSKLFWETHGHEPLLRVILDFASAAKDLVHSSLSVFPPQGCVSQRNRSWQPQLPHAHAECLAKGEPRDDKVLRMCALTRGSCLCLL